MQRREALGIEFDARNVRWMSSTFAWERDGRIFAAKMKCLYFASTMAMPLSLLTERYVFLQISVYMSPC